MENNTRLNWQDPPEQRLSVLRNFRITNQGNSLKHCIQVTLDFYSQIPIGSMSIDPYDKGSWLTLWQMIHSNDFCEFNRALLYAYTLHYLGHACNVQVGKTKDNHHMICVVNDYVLNIEYNGSVDLNWLKNNNWQCEQVYDTNQLC